MIPAEFGVVIFFIFALIAFFHFANLIEDAHCNHILYRIYEIVIAIIAIALIVVVSFIVRIITKSTTSIKTDEIISVENIVALNDNNLVSGHTFCVRGYINEEMYYQYMVDIGNNQYVQNKIPVNKSIVSYIKNGDTNSKPRVEWLREKYRFWIFYENGTYWRIYLPEGSIATDYKIDLQ